MTDCHSSDLLNLPRIERSLSYGGSLYGLSQSIALQAVVSSQEPAEPRKYPRFQPDIKMYILHSTLGTVKDISMDGLSYTYYQVPGTPARSLPKTGTIFSAERGILKDIPFNVVEDTVSLKSAPCLPELKQRQITFNGLSGAQCELLEEFILNHISIPSPECSNGWFRKPKLAHVRRNSHTMPQWP